MAAVLRLSYPDLDRSALAEEAVKLWGCCALEIRLRADRIPVPLPPVPPSPFPQPKEFPASFGTFLRLIVPGPTEADRTANFRKWVKAAGPQPDPACREPLQTVGSPDPEAAGAQRCPVWREPAQTVMVPERKGVERKVFEVRLVDLADLPAETIKVWKMYPFGSAFEWDAWAQRFTCWWAEQRNLDRVKGGRARQRKKVAVR